MKRILSIILCLLLVLPFATPVLAAGASMSLSSSAGTLHRGDSFTVTVKLNNSQSIGRGGIVLKYDANVFEITGGNCNVSGAALAEVSASRKGGVFALEENRVVSGTIFTINMKVKSNAPFGSYTISGSASMDISCSVSGTQVSVACVHSYGGFTTVNASSHKHQCSICGHEETLPHTWDGGTEKKEATCEETGLMSYKCTACAQTKEEEIPKSKNHKYKKWEPVDENTHQGKCSVCGKKTTKDHKWVVETVTKPATCTEAGSQNMICEDCGATKVEKIPITAHSFTAFEKVDESTHRHSCTSCGLEEVLEHSYSGQVGHDPRDHYEICDGCGNARNPAAHIPGEAATAETPQICTVCARTLKAALNHVHSFAATWSSDEQTHWFACETCDERSSLQLHSFDSSCDATCDTCGFQRTAPHDFSDVLTVDEQGHYYACKGCGQQKEFTAHVPGEAASIYAAQTCETCGYELTARLAHDHEFTVENGLHLHQCICGETTDADLAENCPICAADPGIQFQRFPWWIVCAVETVLLVIAGVLLILKKKRIKTYRPG